MKKTYQFENQDYELIINERDGFNKENVEERFTDYFLPYDYVVGDWSYGKLRLKGFYNKGSKGYNYMNDYRTLDRYIKNDCAYGCKYFVLEKVVSPTELN